MMTLPSEVLWPAHSRSHMWHWLGFIYMLACLRAVIQGQNVSNKHEEQQKPNKGDWGSETRIHCGVSETHLAHMQGCEQLMGFVNLKVANTLDSSEIQSTPALKSIL